MSEELLKTIRDKLDAVKNSNKTPLQKEVIAVIKLLDQELAEPSELESNFSEFFTSVGQGMIDAQTTMDLASEHYLAALNHKERPYLNPSVFRIPKVAGDIRFAFRQTKGKGINLLLFSKKSAAEKFQEQSVSFEMQAVPIAADAASRIDSVLAPIRMLIDTDLRKEVFSPIEAHFSAVEDVKDGLLKHRQDALIFGDMTRDVIYILGHYRVGDSRRITLWDLTNPASEDRTMSKIWGLSEASAAVQFKGLMEIYERLQAMQKARQKG